MKFSGMFVLEWGAEEGWTPPLIWLVYIIAFTLIHDFTKGFTKNFTKGFTKDFIKNFTLDFAKDFI